MTTFQDFMKNYWSVIFSVVTCIVTLTAGYYSYGFRITDAEEDIEQNRAAIVTLQENQSDFKVSLGRLETSVDNLSDDLNYIRNKLDRIFP